MFTRPIDKDLSLAIVQPSFAKEYLKISATDKDYIGEWLSWPHMKGADTEDFFLDFVKRSLISFAEGTGYPTVMIYQGEVVGNMFFNSVNKATKTAEVGYWLKQDMQGKGIVTRGVKKLIEIGFEELGMTKIQIRCATENTASRGVPERLGFTLEGIITQAENINGKINDFAVYGLYKKP